MPTVKSLEDLKRIREEALKKREIKEQTDETEIIVSMGTPGIAAGARETTKAILEFIAANHLQQITVRQTGNIGMDSFEPIVQIRCQGMPPVTYGKISADQVEMLLRSHLLDGQIVQEFVIET
ncbi:MAG: (2Fe-2S) ferredoxin domain-containing protein [Anaerolineales bacterium]|jgi:NADP-reducing hydrogenase subunit HndB